MRWRRGAVRRWRARPDADLAVLRISAAFEERKTIFETYFHAGSLDILDAVIAHVAEVAAVVPAVIEVLLERAVVLEMLSNALDAARAAGAKFVYFDNTYMSPQDDRVQTEDTPFEPAGRKGKVRAAMASMVLEEMARGEMPVLIGRAPEFYGPGRTQSFTNGLIIDRLKAGKKPLVPVRDDKQRTLIWTPDASRAGSAGQCARRVRADLAPPCRQPTAHLPAVRRDGEQGSRPRRRLHRRSQVDSECGRSLLSGGARDQGVTAALQARQPLRFHEVHGAVPRVQGHHLPRRTRHHPRGSQSELTLLQRP